ncbi:MAG TPA: type IV pilus biogenesis/stability protein PilW [Gammaproteobacteria bacterium]|nr:type IV pilus biogenesis/stability protein PilW [Gammaproteobacteria bacterium]
MRSSRCCLVMVIVTLLMGCVSTSNNQFPSDAASIRQASQDNVTLGIKYLQQGKRDVAMQKVQKAIELDPDNGDAYMGEAMVYSATGDPQRADDAYHTALRKSPDDPEIQNNYAVFLCEHGKAADSTQYFMEAASNPKYSTPDAAYANAGVCASLVPDPVSAEKYFRRAVDINPNFPEPLYQLAQLSYTQKKYLQARAFIERFNAVTQQQRPEALLLGMNIERALGNQQGATDYAKQLIKQFPTSPQAQQLTQGSTHGG